MESTDTTLRSIGSVSSGVFSAVPGLSISLAAGVWMLTYGVTAQTGFSSGTGEAYSVARVRNTTDSTNVVGSAGSYATVASGVVTPGGLISHHSGVQILNISSSKNYEVQVGWALNSGTPGGATQYARNDWVSGGAYLRAVRIA